MIGVDVSAAAIVQARRNAELNNSTNVEFIEAVEPGTSGQLHVQLRGGPEVEISRRQARVFKTLMSV